VIELNGRSILVAGEDLLLRCNTTPPDLPVAWERNTVITPDFANLADDPRSSFHPPNTKTTANLTNINTGDSGDYECFSSNIPQLANIRARANDNVVLPGMPCFFQSAMIFAVLFRYSDIGCKQRLHFEWQAILCCDKWHYSINFLCWSPTRF